MIGILNEPPLGTVNWDAYGNRLVQEPELCLKVIATAADIQLLLEDVQSAITTTYEAALKK